MTTKIPQYFAELPRPRQAGAMDRSFRPGRVIPRGGLIMYRACPDDSCYGAFLRRVAYVGVPGIAIKTHLQVGIDFYITRAMS